MSLLYLSHPDCLAHQMQPGHPERPDRLRAIDAHLARTGLQQSLEPLQAAPIAADSLSPTHQTSYLRSLTDRSPSRGLVPVDPDTALCPASLSAARLAAGAVVEAVARVFEAPGRRAFCAVRPPGHHAERDAAMGFCFYNSIALGADAALTRPGIERVAILDFDVHHGNGTVDIFRDRPEVLVCSSFQHPFYPYRLADIVRPNIINTPLDAGTGSAGFRRRISADWLPALERHRPQLILVSAGFDAHREDPLGGLDLDEEDFRWITALIRDAADHYCEGRIVSALEGGYDLDALARSVHAHLQALLD
ncbi:MAG: histone deacetylase family protein [Pseudomonadales bacterium]